MDPNNPNLLYAAVWQAQRYPHKLVNGGEECGLWRSTDGGDTWEEISRKPGLPKGLLGKIGVAASPARPDRVWAVVEAEDGAFFRSDDAGETWIRLSEEPLLRTRPWYYMHVTADTTDADTVYVQNYGIWKSSDAGATLVQLPTRHGDEHALWIDPVDHDRMVKGDDGGAAVTLNGGVTWSTIYNQPTAQFYHVIADDQFPYRIYGSQQDNTSLSLPSRTTDSAIHERTWNIPGGGESGYVGIKPDEPWHIVASGPAGRHIYNDIMTHYDHRTGQVRNITVWPELFGWGVGAESLKYRFQWTFPIFFSPHAPHDLYVASNHVHRSSDLGQLLRGGQPGSDPERSGQVEALRGADHPGQHRGRGLLHDLRAGRVAAEEGRLLGGVGRRAGAHLAGWRRHLGERHTAGSAGVGDDLDHRRFAPRSWDRVRRGHALQGGRHRAISPQDERFWEDVDVRSAGGIPDGEFTRVIREDPNRKGTLYAGTETGLYVSFDDGGSWRRLGGNFPVVPIYDLIIKGVELVVATHGRSFWILDDVTLLHQLADGTGSEARLFAPKSTVRLRTYDGFAGDPNLGYVNYAHSGSSQILYDADPQPDGTTSRKLLTAGANPPSGVVVTYVLPEGVSGKVSLAFLDADGMEIRNFTNDAEADPPRVPTNPGVNRFVWNLRYPGPTKITATDLEPGHRDGPLVMPGTYVVRLTSGGFSAAQTFEVLPDPRIQTSTEDLTAQRDFQREIVGYWSRVNELVNCSRCRPGPARAVEEPDRRGQGHRRS